MKYTVDWDDEALEQVLVVLSEIKASGGVKKRKKMANEIKRVEDTILLMPHSGLDMENSKFQYFNILGRYKLIYQVLEDTFKVRFLLFWDGRRNPDDLQRWFEKF